MGELEAPDFSQWKEKPCLGKGVLGGVGIALGIGPHSAALGPAPLIPLPCFLPYSHVEWAKCCVTQPVGSKEKQNQAVQGGEGVHTEAAGRGAFI